MFDGFIAGTGTTSGVRLVVGLWPRSPLGRFLDVMVERPDGHRMLLAPNSRVAEFVAATYSFDEIRIEELRVGRAGSRVRVSSDSLELEFVVGRPTVLGLLLGLVPERLARWPRWSVLLDPLACRLLPGVHTVGSAGNGRREYYGALGQRRIVGVTGVFDRTELGTLAPITPPVRFGFGSVPTTPSIVRITTTVEHHAGDSMTREPQAATARPAPAGSGTDC